MASWPRYQQPHPDGYTLMLPSAGRSSLPRAAAAQATSGALTAAVWVVSARSGVDTQSLPVWVWGGCWGGLAAAMTAFLRLPFWWLVLQFCLPVLLWTAQAADLGAHVPAWLYPLILVLIAGFYWNAWVEGVPLYLSNQTAWKALADNVPDHDHPTFVDLGCGLGGTLAYLGKHYPNGSFVGVETSPLTFVMCKLRFLLFGPRNVTIRFLSIWELDLGPFDVAYCFLSPRPMARLYDKAQAEMRAGAALISNSFAVPDHPPADEVELGDRRKTRLMRWWPAGRAEEGRAEE